MTDSSVTTDTTAPAHDNVTGTAGDAQSATFAAATEVAAVADDAQAEVADVTTAVSDVQHGDVVGVLDNLPRDVSDTEKLIGEVHKMLSEIHPVIMKIQPVIASAEKSLPEVEKFIESLKSDGIGALLGLMGGAH